MSKSHSSKSRDRAAGSSGSSKGGTGKRIWAAGGVLWRRSADGIEIGLIHRPRYDDWTLPKGKLDPGETLLHTATREIAEETGHLVRLGRHLKTVTYDLPHGRKHVRYWSAESIGGEFTANHEVDILEWVTPVRAAELLSYRLDRKVLDEFVRLPADLDTLVIVRHARAGRRSRYKGDDRLRPLDSVGREQAQAMVPLLAAFGVTELHSADRVRCVQTMEPTSASIDAPILIEPAVSEEAYAADPEGAQQRILDLIAPGDLRATDADDQIGQGDKTIRAVCSQGKVIAPLMQWWSQRDQITLPAARNRKGSVWVISASEGKLVAADHIDSALP